jgi:hypothetical protein
VSPADGTVYATGSYTEGDQRRGGLYVIDVADAERLVLVASIELPEHTSSNVTLAGNYAYVTLAECQYFTCSGSLQVIDVSDPTQPRLASSRDVPGGAFALTVTDDGEGGRYGYLAAGEAGVWVVDLSDPGQPGLVWLADTPRRARGIAVRDDLVYVGDDQGGLLILQVVNDR